MWWIRSIIETLQRTLPWLFVVVLLSAAYGYMSNEDYNDQFSVTFTFSCKTVLANTHEYPLIVVDECIKLSREMGTK